MKTTALRQHPATPTVRQQIEKMRAGLSFRAVTNLQKALALPLGTMATVLGMSRATLHRRKVQGKIDQDESERLMRYQRLLKKAEDVFGDVESARTWMTTKQPGLAKAVPLDFARTEIGAREVENLLGRIEYGVYS
jgi:putative toxin-antitoxin system antitoxin component (TIGR02293 family)